MSQVLLVYLTGKLIHHFQSPPEIGELIGIPNAGRLVHRLVHNFPKLQYVNTVDRCRIDLPISV